MSNLTKSSEFKDELVLLHEENGNLKCTIVDTFTKEVMSVTTLDSNFMKKFVKDIPEIFADKIKAVFVYIVDYTPAGYANSYHFRKAMKIKFDQIKIPYYFFNDFQWPISSMLISMDYGSKLNEVVFFMNVYDDGVHVTAYKFTQDGYAHSQLKYRQTKGKSDEEIGENICNLSAARAIFMQGDSENMKRLKMIFWPMKVYIFEDGWNQKIPKILMNHAKWLLNRKFVRYHICPATTGKIRLFTKIGDIELPLIGIEKGLFLPVTKTDLVKKLVTTCTVSMTHNDIVTILDTVIPDQNAHQHECTLAIDEQGFVDYQIKAIFWPHVKILPTILSKKSDLKIPVIVFGENLSLICVRKNDGKNDYCFLDSWKGEFGMDLFISFDEEKPKFFQDALEVFKTKPTFVVFNIFSKMTESPENIQQLPEEQFIITKDDEHPILFEFDHFGETKKFSTPAFLMAMLIKQHLKAIKAETGEKPKKIAFSTFIGLNDEEMNRFKNGMEEACKMLKLSCEFLNLKDIF